MRLCCLSDHALDALLRDDVPHGDLTTGLLGMGEAPAVFEFRMRADSVLAGAEEAARLFELAGASVEFERSSGTALQAGEVFLRGTGSAAALHIAWKTAQTLVEYASGVASRTADIVAAATADGRVIPVACTRKTIPGTKVLAVKAIRAGGAWPHRLGLSDTLLVFPEHLVFIDAAQRDVVLGALRRRSPERRIVAEAGSIDDAIGLARAGVDVVQLEKFTPAEVARCVRMRAELGLQTVLAAAGGVNERNAREYALAGADVLVTSAPYYAPPRDVTVSLRPCSDT